MGFFEEKRGMVGRVLLALLLVSMVGSGKAWAAKEKKGEDAGETTVTLSQAELDAINKAVADKLAAVQGPSPIKVGANFQFLYSHISNGSAGTGGVYTSSKNQWDAFSFKRLEIFLNSTVPGEHPLIWAMSFDFAQASFNGLGSTAGTTVTTGLENPFTLVKDMWGKINFDPAAVVFVGQNKFPQGLEGRTPTSQLDFNSYANLTTYFGNKRDIGVQMMGDKIALGPAMLEYSVDLIQGAGQSTADNNVDKDIAARLGITYDEFFLGTSGYDGWEPNGARYDWGVEGKWTSGPIRVQAEFILGQVNPADSATQNNSTWSPLATTVNKQVDPQGYYLMANYRYQDWRFGARWDGYNPDQTTGSAFNSEMDTITLGADWYLDKDKYKLTVNWEDHLIVGVEKFNIWNVQTQFFI